MIVLRSYILSIWKMIDTLYFFCSRLQYVHSNRDSNGIFRVRLTRFKGCDAILSDGTSLNKNDVLLKIHLHNNRILREMITVDSPLKKGMLIYKRVYASMPLLAEYIKLHPNESEIKGIIGVTMLNRGVRKLGFDSVAPQNPWYKWIKKITQLPIYLISTSSYSLSHLKKQTPAYLIMSKEKLFREYGEKIKD